MGPARILTTAILALATLGAAAAAPAAPLEPRQALPPSERIRITSVTGTGSGCPAGTWTVQVSQDGSSATLGFDRFEATLSPATDRDVRCAVAVLAAYPSGGGGGGGGGCVASTVVATSHGFAEFPATGAGGGSITATLEAAYGVSPGRFTTGSFTQAPLAGAAWAGGQPWVRTDSVGTVVNAGGGTGGGRSVLFQVNARSFFAAPSGSGVFGSVRTDDLSISFTNQRRVAGQC